MPNLMITSVTSVIIQEKHKNWETAQSERPAPESGLAGCNL